MSVCVDFRENLILIVFTTQAYPLIRAIIWYDQVHTEYGVNISYAISTNTTILTAFKDTLNNLPPGVLNFANEISPTTSLAMTNGTANGTLSNGIAANGTTFKGRWINGTLNMWNGTGWVEATALGVTMTSTPTATVAQAPTVVPANNPASNAGGQGGGVLEIDEPGHRLEFLHGGGREGVNLGLESK